MIIGICSDSHDHVEHIKKAVSYFNENGIKRVIHAGDYCSPFTIPLFEGLDLHGVFGNNDGDKYLLMKKFDEIGATLHGDFFSFEIDKIKFAVYHGTYPDITEALEKCGKYDVVISGHTHVTKMDTIGDTLSINPGSVNGFDTDAMVATFDTETRKVQFKELG
ncbi:metallophosphoesterase [Rhodohalobacter sulfatireducens]|uniref:Phosphoesterase n=1 Tax=Rhodohalobacter sulfatireducens TaxID=2911366 RepID=A0ABS9KB14_9BACT|nr:metallophosphoesterase [Rhodohalobacter sulfatireducens]MCG2588020.1 metallophosphoesterase [Rhodohalobacter sulfatireducens]